MARGAIVGFFTASGVTPHAQQPGLELDGVRDRPALQKGSVGLDGLLDLFDLEAHTLEQVAHLGGQILKRLADVGLRPKARKVTHVRPPRGHGESGCVVELGLQTLDEGSHGVLFQIPLGVDVDFHAARQPRLGRAKHHRVQVSQGHIPVAQPNAGRRHLTRDHLRRLVVEVAIVGRAAGIANHDSDPRPAPRAASPLGIVIRPGRDIAQQDRVQAAHVDAHLHRWRTCQHVQR